MASALEVGKKLVELCKAGKFKEAMDSTYGKDIVSIEAGGPPGQSLRTEGIAAVKAKGEWWEKNHEVHSAGRRALAARRSVHREIQDGCDGQGWADEGEAIYDGGGGALYGEGRESRP